jgi:hypothetical protein
MTQSSMPEELSVLESMTRLLTQRRFECGEYYRRHKIEREAPPVHTTK